MMKAEVCEECYLQVSKKYEGGFPYKLTDENNNRLETVQSMSARSGPQNFGMEPPQTVREPPLFLLLTFM